MHKKSESIKTVFVINTCFLTTKYVVRNTHICKVWYGFFTQTKLFAF